MISVLDLSEEELAEGLGVPAYRARQIFHWVKKGVFSFDDMRNLPLDLRRTLNESYYVEDFKRVHALTSIDGTIKVLGKFHRGEMVEAVLMSYSYGKSACISTQVGCRMACDFCASTKAGLIRNLSAGEMLGEVYRMTAMAGEKLSNIVLMGMGEPLDNYDEVLKFLRRVTSDTFYGISARSITVSTCGLVPRIRQFAEEEFSATLAFSLHNPFQAEREKIMRISKQYSVDEALDAVKYYFEKTKRRITIEYALITGENDEVRHADELARHLLKRGKSIFHVNLIPLNEHELTTHTGSSKKRVLRFKNILESKKINVTIRRELGSDIDAACGQLKNNWRNYG